MQGIFERMKIDTLATGLRTASVKNGVIAENIANKDTPGYKAQDLEFYDVMDEVLGTGKKLPLTRTNEKHLPPAGRGVDPSSFVYQQNNPSVRNDGNDVNVDYEMTQMAENTIRYNMMADMTAGKFTKLKNIIAGRS
ncbi:flagellar basal-body rod protein FlgB [Denitrovibrio acetiphilus DSM 12809]|uniref:Flagellar basal body rod protein FlgB n=1 Tax=Denitrovibrio acetiphilus (strain DSM 12809 / NBRC 114555 / N2460) TaxID=522772 RepID=D4H356_DENA2|nr:flagellar basal body rod protein FlgB [Denitrovibrio acetiphilus]ADD69079.1 flagellar basal-body rod protein FlgB [Denitrovibrio acetiphilus DSM 12809]